MTKIKLYIKCNRCLKHTVCVSEVDGVTDEHVELLCKRLKEFIGGLECEHCRRKIAAQRGEGV